MVPFGGHQHPGPLESHVLQVGKPPLLSPTPLPFVLYDFVFGEELLVDGSRVLTYRHFSLHVMNVPMPQQAGRDSLDESRYRCCLILVLSSSHSSPFSPPLVPSRREKGQTSCLPQ